MTRPTLATIFCVLAFVFIVPLAYAATSQSVQVNLLVPGCGDGICEANLGENATTCPQDCGTGGGTSTPTTTPATTTPVSGNTAPSVTTGSVATMLNVSGVGVEYQGKTVLIGWHNPPGMFSGVRIVRSPYGIPTDPFAGEVVYQGSGTYTIDTTGIPGTTYFYTIFSYNGVGQYSSGTVFAVVWPGSNTSVLARSTTPIQNQSPQPYPQTKTTQYPASSFPRTSSFPPPSVASTTPIAPVITATTTTASSFTLGELLFIQNGQQITPAAVNGALPLTVALPNSVITQHLPGGLVRAILTLNILGQKDYYLLRENATDHAWETSIDLSTTPAGGYPLSVEFWPNTTEPFIVSGTLSVTQPIVPSVGFLGTGLSLTNLAQIVGLLVLLAIFMLMLRFAHRS